MTKAIQTETVEFNGHTLKTNYWYMNCAKELTGGERHRIFYGQFVTDAVKRMVSANFTKAEWAALAKSYNEGNEHLNGVTILQQWDRCDVRHLVGRMVTECNWTDVPRGTIIWSPSNNVCVTKQAAIQMIESGNYPK